MGKMRPVKKQPNSLRRLIFHKKQLFNLARNLTYQAQQPVAMYKLEIISRWNVVKAILKQKHRMLTDEDLVFSHGREGELISRLQLKLGKSRADIMRLIGEVK